MQESKSVTNPKKKGAETTTTFIEVKWPESDQQMVKPKASTKTVSNGEAAMAKFRTPC